MKPEGLKDLTLEELIAKTEELQGEFFNARVRKATGQLENTAKLKSLRRDIARVKTIMSERRGATK